MNLICQICGEEKDILLFQKAKATKSGFIKTCKKCVYNRLIEARKDPEKAAHMAAVRKARYDRIKAENKDGKYDKYIERGKKYRLKKKGHYLLYSCRSRAKVEGALFNLSVDDIVIPEICPLLGVPIIVHGGPKNLYSPSIDRLIPSLGYVKQNIRVISRKANFMKSSASKEELLAFASNIEKYVNNFPNEKQ